VDLFRPSLSVLTGRTIEAITGPRTEAGHERATTNVCLRGMRCAIDVPL